MYSPPCLQCNRDQIALVFLRNKSALCRTFFQCLRFQMKPIINYERFRKIIVFWGQKLGALPSPIWTEKSFQTFIFSFPLGYLLGVYFGSEWNFFLFYLFISSCYSTVRQVVSFSLKSLLCLSFSHFRNTQACIHPAHSLCFVSALLVFSPPRKCL